MARVWLKAPFEGDYQGQARAAGGGVAIRLYRGRVESPLVVDAPPAEALPGASAAFRQDSLVVSLAGGSGSVQLQDVRVEDWRQGYHAQDGATIFGTISGTLYGWFDNGAPNAPSGLTAVASDGSVALAWDAALPDSEAYRLERAADADFTKDVAALNPSVNARSYRDVPGTGTYFYRVMASNPRGASPWSAPVSVTVESARPSPARVQDRSDWIPSHTAEVVFVLDTSASMEPCFDGLCQSIGAAVEALGAAGVGVRFGFVALHVVLMADTGALGFPNTVSNRHGINDLYSGVTSVFTTSVDGFVEQLERLKSGLTGDEHQLIALDSALDFPFSPRGHTHRAVAIFSDEPIENGRVSADDLAKIEALVTKIDARGVHVFAAVPASPALDRLARARHFESVPVSAGDGLASVNFASLLTKMVESLLNAVERNQVETYERALFGQDGWTRTSKPTSSEGLR